MSPPVQPIRNPEVKRTQLFIGNEFVNSVAGKTFETVNPATEDVICLVSIKPFIPSGYNETILKKKRPARPLLSSHSFIEQTSHFSSTNVYFCTIFIIPESFDLHVGDEKGRGYAQETGGGAETMSKYVLLNIASLLAGASWG